MLSRLWNTLAALPFLRRQSGPPRHGLSRRRLFGLTAAGLASSGTASAETILRTAILASNKSAPSLDLNFLNGAIDPRIAFSRASGATYFDATGTLQTANANVPRIDYGPAPGGVTNWVKNSTTGTVYCAGNNFSIASADIAPLFPGTHVWKNGSTSAGDNNIGYLTATNVVMTPGLLYTQSVYVWIPSAFTGSAVALSASTSTPAVYSNANMTLRNQWQRITITWTPPNTSAVPVLRPTINPGDFIYTTAWQIESGATANPYVPTSGAPVNIGAIPLGLLPEEQRTNFIRNPRAEGAFTGGLGAGNQPATNWVYVNNASGLTLTGAPITSAGMTGIRLTWSGTTSATPALETVEFDARTVIAVATGQVWTGSFYFRFVAGTLPAGLKFGTRILTFTSAYAVVDNAQTNAAVVDGTLRRVVATQTVGTNATTIIHGLNLSNFPVSTACNFTVDVFFPQMEKGAIPTSVVLPPAGSPAAATRAADSIAMPLGSWFNPNAGTLSVEFMQPPVGATTNFNLAGFYTNDYLQYVDMFAPTTPTTVGTVFRTSSTPHPYLSNSMAVNTATPTKAAASYSAAASSKAVNGAIVGTFGAAPIPTGLSTLVLGSLNGFGQTPLNVPLRRVRYWPRKVADTELTGTTR